jgi:hypothetical protein
VFVLDIDLDTKNRRIDERVALDATDFGGKPEERELAVRLHQTKEDIPKNGIIIDATAPLARVVDEILSKCREAGLDVVPRGPSLSAQDRNVTRPAK